MRLLVPWLIQAITPQLRPPKNFRRHSEGHGHGPLVAGGQSPNAAAAAAASPSYLQHQGSLTADPALWTNFGDQVASSRRTSGMPVLDSCC